MAAPKWLTGWLGCCLLVAICAVARAAASYGIDAPWIAPDEVTYGVLGTSLWKTGQLTILGSATPFYGIVYPALAGLPLSLFGPATGVHVLQVLQPLLMSTTAFLTYGWARRLASPPAALLAAALTLAIPALAYAGLIMTEVAYYPLATLALLATAHALEKPVLERQALAVSALLLACLTRLQGLVLVPVLVTAIFLVAWFARSLQVVRRFGLTLALLLLATIAVGVLHFTGGSGDLLGAYSTTTRTSYEAGPVLTWIAWHVADVLLLVAGVPLLALLALGVDAFLGRERSAGVRALVAVSLAYAAWLVVQVGAFASRYSDLLLERNLITVAPPLFVALSVWLSRGAPRPQPWTTIAVAPVVAAAVALPVGRLTDPAAAPDAFTPLALAHLRGSLTSTATTVVYVAGVLVVVALFLALPRRGAVVLPALALALLGGASALAYHDVAHRSSSLRAQLFGQADPRWVDRATDADVAYLYARSTYWNSPWMYAFWNRRIVRLLALPDTLSGELPAPTLVTARFDGRLYDEEGREVETPYVVVPGGYDLAGTIVTSVPVGTDVGQLFLWRIAPPLRLQSARVGFLPNGDIVGRAEVDVYACGPGSLKLTLLGKQGTPVRLTVDGQLWRTIAPAPGSVAHVSIPSPPDADGRDRCAFGIDSGGLLGSTTVLFERGA